MKNTVCLNTFAATVALGTVRAMLARMQQRTEARKEARRDMPHSNGNGASAYDRLYDIYVQLTAAIASLNERRAYVEHTACRIVKKDGTTYGEIVRTHAAPNMRCKLAAFDCAYAFTRGEAARRETFYTAINLTENAQRASDKAHAAFIEASNAAAADIGGVYGDGADILQIAFIACIEAVGVYWRVSGGVIDTTADVPHKSIYYAITRAVNTYICAQRRDSARTECVDTAAAADSDNDTAAAAAVRNKPCEYAAQSYEAVENRDYMRGLMDYIRRECGSRAAAVLSMRLAGVPYTDTDGKSSICSRLDISRRTAFNDMDKVRNACEVYHALTYAC